MVAEFGGFPRSPSFLAAEDHGPSRYPIRRGMRAIADITGFGRTPRSSAVSLAMIARRITAAPIDRNGCGGNMRGLGLTIGSRVASVSAPLTRSAITLPARWLGATPLPV